MRPPHHLLHRNQVHRVVAEHLQAHLNFKDYKRSTSAQVLWSLLLAAATARITSLSDACQRQDNVPSDETARKALLATLPDYAVPQQQLKPRWPGTCLIRIPERFCPGQPGRLAHTSCGTAAPGCARTSWDAYKTLRKHLQRLAIDLTLIPYHGKPFRYPEAIYRGQAKGFSLPLET
jgi:hypothetical protein